MDRKLKQELQMKKSQKKDTWKIFRKNLKDLFQLIIVFVLFSLALYFFMKLLTFHTEGEFIQNTAGMIIEENVQEIYHLIQESNQSTFENYGSGLVNLLNVIGYMLAIIAGTLKGTIFIIIEIFRNGFSVFDTVPTK